LESMRSIYSGVQKNLKKSLPKICASNKTRGHYTQTGKSVDVLLAVSLKATLHMQIPSTSITTNEKELRFTFSLL
jgi:hypothetical protein